MRWDQGRAEVDALINAGEIERIHPDRDAAGALLQQARSHLESAAVVANSDAPGAYSLMYDAARKSLAAVLENQGLRATSRGGHLAVYRAVRAQLDPPLGRVLQPFDRMRRRRNTLEYGAKTNSPVTVDEIDEDSVKARAIVDTAAQTLDNMSPF